MDGSHERQGVVLGEKTLVELREMLERQEKLLASSLCPRLPDSGRRVRDLVDRLRRALAERERLDVHGPRPAARDEEEEEEDEEDAKEMRNILLRRSQNAKIVRKPRFVPNKTRAIREESEDLSDLLRGVSLTGDDDLPIPTMTEEEWAAAGASVSPPASCRRPPVTRQECPEAGKDLGLVIVDVLPDPGSDDRYIELSACRIRLQDTTVDSSAVDSVSYHCLPGYLDERTSKRCGLSLRFKTLQEKTETSDAVVQPSLWSHTGHQVDTYSPEAAMSLWGTAIVGEEPGRSSCLLLPPSPPGLRNHRRRLLKALASAPGLREAPGLLLLDVARCGFVSEPHDLSPRAGCVALARFLHGAALPRLFAAGAGERLHDRLALLAWAGHRDARLAALRRHLVDVPDAPLTAPRAAALADRGWDFPRLQRAATEWPRLVAALAPDRSLEEVEVARRLFRHFRRKLQRMELHRGELLPEKEPTSTRKALLLSMPESLAVMRSNPQSATLPVRPAAFRHTEYRETRPEEEEDSLDSDDDEEGEEEMDAVS